MTQWQEILLVSYCCLWIFGLFFSLFFFLFSFSFWRLNAKGKKKRGKEETLFIPPFPLRSHLATQPPRRLRCSKVERAGNESSFALCRLKLEEPMFRKISYLGFNLQRKEDERWKEFRNKGYFVSGIFPIVPPVPFVSSSSLSRGRMS